MSDKSRNRFENVLSLLLKVAGELLWMMVSRLVQTHFGNNRSWASGSPDVSRDAKRALTTACRRESHALRNGFAKVVGIDKW
jgi:hypothetical protein